MRLLPLAAMLLAGCGSTTPSGGAVTLDQLPAGTMAAAKQKLPNVKFEKAWRNAKGGYDVQGKDAKGKIREIHFDGNGNVTGVE
jgi:hypothetical protein